MHIALSLFPAWYLLKMTLVSAILFGWYRTFLRNAPFHSYNRRYLLAAAGASLLLPLLHLPGGWPQPAALTVLAGSTPDPGLHYSPTLAAAPVVGSGWTWVALIYGLVAASLLFRLLPSLIHIIRLTRKYPSVRMSSIRFYDTDAPGTPFSFGNRLFWNSRIPLETANGQAILRHEMTHIRGRHTLDILALEFLRCLFWINPVFHLLLREVRIIHEFLADRKALSVGGDAHQYAESLVWQSAGSGSITRLTHSFFHTHLKRRITMIIKTHPKSGYLSRILALPLFFLLFTAFAAPKPAPRADQMALLRFYNHYLRYPQAALDANLEGTVSFSIRVDANGKLAGFEARPADLTPPAGHKLNDITVTARPSDHQGTAASPKTLMEDIFMEEARKASRKLGEDPQPIAAGKYYLQIKFRIEPR